KPLRAVYGNIDGQTLRDVWSEKQRFMCENVDVLMVHIGGYPGRYERNLLPEISANPPKLFISGHSHILKVIYDKKLDLLHINPGAAGNSGFHKVCTAMRFVIDKSNISDLEIWQLERNIKV
ncbi:MAG: metallophosphatase family protein, partial [Prolixibacteraceae bacterium]|nr:metallophosphatase family protein [Prolixibacteraceae bacterium]